MTLPPPHQLVDCFLHVGYVLLLVFASGWMLFHVGLLVGGFLYFECYCVWRTTPARFFRRMFRRMKKKERDAILTFEDKKTQSAQPPRRRYRPTLTPHPWEVSVVCGADGVEEFTLHLHPQFECPHSAIEVHRRGTKEPLDLSWCSQWLSPAQCAAPRRCAHPVYAAHPLRYAHHEQGWAEDIYISVVCATQVWTWKHRSLWPDPIPPAVLRRGKAAKRAPHVAHPHADPAPLVSDDDMRMMLDALRS